MLGTKEKKKLSESFFLQKQCNSETLAKEFSLGDIKETASHEEGRAVGAGGAWILPDFVRSINLIKHESIRALKNQLKK